MDDTQALGGGGTRPTLAGRYELRGLLGQGGMADVALAYDSQLDREVAVKILHARYADDPAFLARFRREAQAAASLTHPNVVAVYDAGEQESRPFIVMEYVRGRSLSDVVKDEKVVPGRALEMTGDAALGLHYAHERGLIHRDIKPGNILVSEDGQVKVADFGIARAVNAENVTQTATVFGTAAYVAPEQAQGREVDRRTDVYALGCVLYELLTGQQPFSGDSAVALAYKHVSEIPPAPSELNADVTAELDAIVMKAMAKDPDDRYSTAREFNADLQRAEAGLPVSAPPVAAWATTQAFGGDQTAVLAPPPAATAVTDYEDDDDRGGRGLWLVLFGIVVLAIFALAGVLLANLLADQTVEVSVPQVVGMDLAAAQTLIRDEGLEPVVADEEVQTSDVEPGEVARTDPEAGTVVDEGSEVILFVNGGPPMVQVPDLAGQPEDEAQRILIEEGLGLGITQREANEDFERGLVIRTEPAADEEVAEGTEVSLVVSTGPESVTVPDVTDETESDARNTLAGLCEPRPCLQTAVEYETSDDVPEGIVMAQDPPADSTLTIGETVTLTVSQGRATVRLPAVTNQSEDDAIRRMEEACEPRPCVQVEIDRAYSDTIREGRVIEQQPAAGEEVDRGTTVTLLISDGPEPEPEEPDEPDDPDDDDDEDEDGNGNPGQGVGNPGGNPPGGDD
jgi:eukaryotic-like serine/threonine-protein kinase